MSERTDRTLFKKVDVKAADPLATHAEGPSQETKDKRARKRTNRLSDAISSGMLVGKSHGFVTYQTPKNVETRQSRRAEARYQSPKNTAGPLRKTNHLKGPRGGHLAKKVIASRLFRDAFPLESQ